MNATRHLLASCAYLIIAHGADSDEVKRFIEAHTDNSEFVELANLSRALRKLFEEE